ncbi:KdsC family phosphatase [Engelhardtia mirabilis]|uniref:3-deoxy-D-manno-octulosonate 8-phosphate phosphatase KdsC n=1 Tax=Engelhardtia mirabilis TaxID=2528011 RepID=A0A518BD89_9BACT|nr:3-deoxy-D-manno-octulosonate 8-phosphate phosphatase KdsC [Planctomycetes bacterium Pla133]QDU99274.1 3-deoxy-D-manno-octulosonate 8-phosphate phosphatase KdsC [Planctomycetes bacterium Pla86]
MTATDPELEPELRRTLAGVRLAVFDVDGTLTDGSVVYGDGTELQSFSVRDGQGLVWLRQAGIELAWISGRGCAATERRAAELGVTHVHLRRGGKAEVLAQVQRRAGVGPEATLAMGDDLPDLALFAGAAVRACPVDAAPELIERANLPCSLPGGRGAAREVCEALLKARGEWPAIVGRYTR